MPMLLRKLLCAFALLLAALPARAADKPWSIKVVGATPPPAEVAEPIRALLSDQCIQLLDAKGELKLEVWFRKALPAKATDGQIQNGLTYAEVPETTLVGAMHVVKLTTDYRKQKIKPGVYTLRIARQPMDGDHMGTAPYGDFCLALPAAEDKKPDTMEVKALHEISAKSTSSHPGVFLLFPGKDAAAEPKLVNKGDGHWVLILKQDVTVGDKKTTIGIGLTLIGASPSA
jgi:hypothetical protein